MLMTKSANFQAEQFELWFQPIHHVVSGDILHHEALIRHRSSEGHLDLPQQFLPLISCAGMAQWLDRLVIHKAVSLLAQEPNLHISINLSKEALCDNTLAEYIQTSAIQYRVKPQQLSFELAESIVSENFQATVEFIKQLKPLGHLFILDSFANQSLTFPKWEKLAVDLVKIDGNLIQKIKTDCSSRFLIETIVKWGHALGQLTVAKSVNNITTSKLVKDIGVDYIQGFYIKSPTLYPNWTNKVNILNVFIDNLSRTELLEQLTSGVVFTPNVDHIIKLQGDLEFIQAYSIADYKICDSQIVTYASKFLGKSVKEKISGSDFFSSFCQYHKNKKDIKIFLLGAPEGVASKAEANINSKIGRRIVVGSHSPSFGFERDEKECLDIVKMVNSSGATVLAIGVGAPKQEKWIYKHKSKLPSIKIFLAIGATIEFEADAIKRAPPWMSTVGFEWLHRLSVEPHRLWKRYLIDDIPFLFMILKQKISNSRKDGFILRKEFIKNSFIENSLPIHGIAVDLIGLAPKTGPSSISVKGYDKQGKVMKSNPQLELNPTEDS